VSGLVLVVGLELVMVVLVCSSKKVFPLAASRARMRLS